MSFQPVIAGQGLAGWRFLQRTYDAQLTAFGQAPQMQRDIDHFSEAIAEVRTAADLVTDRRLLSVALGAFGLSDDLSNRYFISRILSDGTGSRDALANRLTDTRYRRLSAAFGFGPGESVRTGNTAEMIAITGAYRTGAFEVAVGEQDDTIRTALYAQKELAYLADRPASDQTKWFSMMGLPPLRAMFETALGLPPGFGQIDIEKQLSVFRDRTQSTIGETEFSGFSNPQAIEKLTNLYLARSQIADVSSGLSSQSTALALLRMIPT